MAINSQPLVALGIRSNYDAPDLIGNQVKLSALAGQRQNQQIQAQQAPLVTQQLQQENQMRDQQLKDQQAQTRAMQQWDGKDFGKIPELFLKNGGSGASAMALKSAILKQQQEIQSLDTTQLTNEAAKNDHLLGQLDAIKSLPDEAIGQGLNQALPGLVQSGMIDPQHAQQISQLASQQDPKTLRQSLDLFEKGLTGHKEQLAQASKAQADRIAAADEARKAAIAPAQLASAQAKATTDTQDAALSPVQRALKSQSALEYYAAQGDPIAQKALAEKIRVAQASRPINNLMGPNDAKDITKAIANGDQPPTLQGLYRNAGPVRAELARQGVPLAKMEMDWNATKKYVSTLNGQQQVRLRQAISTASDSLDKIEALYNEFQQLAPTSGIRLINKASLAAAKQLPGRAGAVATNLESQIADITSELGNVYMGGNSPTDHSLALAAKNLSGDWNKQTFEEALKQTRQNIKIRQNSIRHAMPEGTSGDTSYFPQQSGGQPQGAPQKSGSIFARDPQGKLHQAPEGTPLPAGWKLENK